MTEEFDDCPPGASLIESMRAHGYNMATAVADLIDNSIAAGAKNIILKFGHDKSGSSIMILDDGRGMTEEELKAAMTLASISPLDKRDARDLGRFGLGLKTASFSMGRRLTVMTKKEAGKEFIRRWDLDYLREHAHQGWRLLRTPSEKSVHWLDSAGFEKYRAGTLVLVDELDRVFGSAKGRAEKNHMQTAEKVKSAIVTVFITLLGEEVFK